MTYIGDSVDQVGDVGADGPDGGQFLLLSEPLLDADLVFGGHEDVHGQMLEGLGEGAALALDGHHTGLDGHVDALRDGNGLVAVQSLHLETEIGNKNSL